MPIGLPTSGSTTTRLANAAHCAGTIEDRRPHVGAGLALIYALTSLMFGLGLDSSAPHLPVGLAAMAILGALIGAGLPLFTASVLGYHSGSRFDSD